MCEKCNWQGAAQQAKTLLSELPGLPDKAEEFQASVGEKAESMLNWITSQQHVTPKMLTAIANMAGGVKKWQLARKE